MARFSRSLVVACVVAIVLTAVLAVVLRDRLRCSGFAGPGVQTADLPPAAGDESLRIVSWNVRNFPLDERPQQPDLGFARQTNICDLQAVLGGLDADLLGLQEINDTRRFPPILRSAVPERRMGVRFSIGGGRFGQHLAVAWDVDLLELTGEPIDVTDTVLGDGMRPALAAYFRSRRSPDLDFTVVVVHLESGSRAFDERRRQIRALAGWIEDRVRKIGDPDVILLGDFNTTGSPHGGFRGEMQSMEAIFAPAGLRLLPNRTGCSSYSEGGARRDGVQHASTLDHVFLGGFPADQPVVPVQSWLHCARFGCDDLVSRPGEEDGTFWDVSDHCPLTFELRDSAGPDSDDG